ncbi:hypothetical protein [Rhodoferax sp. WC2427]|uniref:hypothetical protein n=1 Tax=Rhodoferax sp. WC2427 TaxID=3234144 RepID=UPI0034666952
MRELFTTLFVFAAAFMLWRTVRPQHRNGDYQMAASPQLYNGNSASQPIYKWPSLGLFQMGAADSHRYQAALKLVADGTPISPAGTQVVAQLHTGGTDAEFWKPVEIRIHGARVGFLSSGDGSRFQRRLTHEGHAGETTCCDALITCTDSHYDIRLDLKEFRH